MVRSLLLTLAMLLSAGAVLAQSTVLTGKVTDDKGEALIGATVKVLKGADFVKGTITDFNGDYRMQIDPGSYDLETSYTGFSTARQTGVQVLSGKINTLDIPMSNSVLNEVIISSYKAPLIEQDKTSGGQTLTSEQIKNLPTRSVNAVVATTAGTTSVDGGEVNIKGSRANGTNYYVDGIRVQGSSTVPIQDIEQLQVITGGLGAEYGDVTGGVISVITKGPASEYHGGIEVENSNGLDPYGYLLATANVSGPILKKKEANGATRTVIGFRMSGQYRNQKDDDPPAVPVHYVKESVLANLEKHPLTKVNGFTVNSAEKLTNDSVNVYKYNPYQNRKNVDLTGKLDFRLTDKIDISLTGTFADQQNKFNPTNDGYASWAIVNAQNNPTDYNRRYRGLARFRHRLGNSDEPESASSNKVTISNASYQIQFGFERGNTHRNDSRHGNNVFDYGYMGRFGFNYVPVAGPDDSTGLIVHTGNREQFTGFQPGYINAAGKLVIPNGGKGSNGEQNGQGGLVAYNEFADPQFYASYLAQNGKLSTTYDDVWGGMYANVNTLYNRIRKTQEDVLTISASSSFDLKLGKTGTHNIQFGLLNEQR
ncbi:MAG: carboxypeptidase regulatory-like domain-containing protein, partial [Bacteroidota bacterium]